MANTRKKTMKKDEGALGGFTIIEVVLVLAIAGLIFLMVFIALPTLQRSQRDTQRRNDLARVSTQLTQYQTNNSGRLPGNGTCTIAAGNTLIKDIPNSAGCKFIRNYMNSSTASEDSESEFVDPSGDPYNLTIVAFKSMGTLSNNFNDKRVYIVTGARCEDEEVVSSNGSRDYAVRYKLEGNGVYCQDNGS